MCEDRNALPRQRPTHPAAGGGRTAAPHVLRGAAVRTFRLSGAPSGIAHWQCGPMPCTLAHTQQLITPPPNPYYTCSHAVLPRQRAPTQSCPAHLLAVIDDLHAPRRARHSALGGRGGGADHAGAWGRRWGGQPAGRATCMAGCVLRPRRHRCALTDSDSGQPWPPS